MRILLLLCAAAVQADPPRQFPLRGPAAGEQVVVDEAGYVKLFGTLPKQMADPQRKAHPVDFTRERLAVACRTAPDTSWVITFDVPRKTDVDVVVPFWFWKRRVNALAVVTTAAAGILLERSALPVRFELLNGEPPAGK